MTMTLQQFVRSLKEGDRVTVNKDRYDVVYANSGLRLKRHVGTPRKAAGKDAPKHG